MPQSQPIPTPPGVPAWDIRFTRLTRTVQPRIAAFALDLAHRFQAIGLGSDTQVRPTPRGLSTFLALVGQRGLICIVDATLVDGMAVGHGPCAALDIRLLDACGDVVADALARGVQAPSLHGNPAAETFHADDLDRAATAVYVAALGHFDVLRPLARQA
jgi:hypothetical protein